MERQIYLTNIERVFLEELQRRGLEMGTDFAIQYPLRYSFILDFAFPKQKIAIEVDGEAFHPAKRDRVKNAILRRLGWRLFRFWGSEVKENVRKCVNKVIGRPDLEF